MADNSSKIDTQGMSGPTDPNYDPKKDKQKFKPMMVKPRRLFTPDYVKEMKILINEVLDEREGNFHYTSYFDCEQYKHPVTEEEPDYTPHYKPSYYQ